MGTTNLTYNKLNAEFTLVGDQPGTNDLQPAAIGEEKLPRGRVLSSSPIQ